MEVVSKKYGEKKVKNARRLYRQGHSCEEIGRRVDAPTSRIRYWTRDIPKPSKRILSPKRIASYAKRKHETAARMQRVVKEKQQAAVRKQQHVKNLYELVLEGKTLQEIGDEQDPPLTRQGVSYILIKGGYSQKCAEAREKDKDKASG